MEQCNRYKQSIQELLQVHKKADKSEKETGNDNHRQPRWFLLTSWHMIDR